MPEHSSVCEHDIFLNVCLYRVTLYAEFLPMKARAKCILLIEVSCVANCIWSLDSEGQILLSVMSIQSH